MLLVLVLLCAMCINSIIISSSVNIISSCSISNCVVISSSMFIIILGRLKKASISAVGLQRFMSDGQSPY